MESFKAQTVRWHDYSKNGIYGDVFTLNVKNGGYLIAALSTFVGFVGPAVWTIMAFALHQSRVSRRRSEDGVYFQTQVILRHPTSALSAVRDILQLCFGWRRRPFWATDKKRGTKRVPHLGSRSTTLLLMPLAIFIGFAIAGVFVSRVAGTSYHSNDVLVDPVHCGSWAYNLQTTAGQVQQQEKNARDALNAKTYARDCYQANSNISTGRCSLYTRPRIEYTKRDAPCPFGADSLGEDACLYTGNQVMQLDTGYINSNSILGINTAPSNQILIRKISKCSPFHATNYVDLSFESTSAGGYAIWNFNLGPLAITGSSSNSTYSYNTHAKEDGIGYKLYSVYTLNGRSWQPVEALQAPKSDISAHFLSQNTVRYREPVSDIWFSANKLDTGFPLPLYDPDQETNVLVCAEQYELGNPNTGFHTGLTKYTDLARRYQQFGFNAYQEAITTRVLLALDLTSIFNTVTNLGPSALLANDNLIELVGTSLPSDQWQREVEGWFQTSLARLQWILLEWVSNTADLGSAGYIVSPDTASGRSVEKAAVKLCSLQRIRNTGAYQTFSFLGVMVVLCVGMTCLLVSWILEWAVTLARESRTKHPERAVALVSDGKFQLLRKNLQVDHEAGNASMDAEVWEGLNDGMPVAKPGIRFLVPRRDDHDYHYSAAPKVEQEMVSMNSGQADSPSSGEGLEHSEDDNGRAAEPQVSEEAGARGERLSAAGPEQAHSQITKDQEDTNDALRDGGEAQGSSDGEGSSRSGSETSHLV